MASGRAANAEAVCLRARRQYRMRVPLRRPALVACPCDVPLVLDICFSVPVLKFILL